MRVLLTNDDGIDAQGLRLLYRSISKCAFITEIWVVAPDSNKSCCSHAMSFNKSIVMRKCSDKRFAVTGTPVDCVVVSVHDLMKEAKPDIIISGINDGANIDLDVIYSGTVAAAREGALVGIPSIAISQQYNGYKARNGIKWQNDDAIFLKLLEDLICSSQSVMKEKSLININLPFVDIIGIKYLAQGNHYLGNHIESKNGPENESTYVIGTNRIEIDSPSLNAGYIIVTPIGVDFTDYASLDALNNQAKIRQGIKSLSLSNEKFRLM